MRWTHRLGGAVTAVMLLSVPALALVLNSSPMSEPQADELLAATAAASMVRGQAPAANTPVVAQVSPLTLTEWTFTGCSPTYPKGDMNFDGVVNGLDVDPFVDVVLRGSNSVPLVSAADINSDCIVNGLDVDPFLLLLLAPSP